MEKVASLTGQDIQLLENEWKVYILIKGHVFFKSRFNWNIECNFSQITLARVYSVYCLWMGLFHYY